MDGTTIITCVYCGMRYPEGTPPSGGKVLTDHIRVCEKHPLRKAEADIAKLRRALMGIVGAEDKGELEAMADFLINDIGPDDEKVKALNAIQALIETIE